ncbi:MAG: O-antigen ligase family protein [Bdellovibrionia bacterium]
MTQLKEKPFLLFWLFFVSLLISQSAMDFFATLIVLRFLFLVIKKQIQLTASLRIFGLLSGLFFVNIGIGFLLNFNDPQYWLLRQYEAFWFLVVFALYFLIREINWKIEKLVYFLVPILLLSLLPMFLFFVSGKKLFSDHGVRFGGIFSEPMTYAHSFGQLTVFLIFLFLGLFYYAGFAKISGSLKKVIFFTALACGASVVLSFTRGVWIGMFFAVLLVSALMSKRLFAIAVASGAAAFVTLYSFWPQFRERVLFTLNPQKTYDSERLALWRANWEMVKDYPLFGTGWGQNKELLFAYYEKLGIVGIDFKSHAHNQLLHFWASTGTVGLLIYLSFFGLVLIKLLKLFKTQSPWVKTLAIALIAVNLEFLISGLTESNFERSRVRYILLLSWAATFYLTDKFLDKKKVSL